MKHLVITLALSYRKTQNYSDVKKDKNLFYSHVNVGSCMVIRYQFPSNKIFCLTKFAIFTSVSNNAALVPAVM